MTDAPLKPFCIVSSNYTSLIAAWPGIAAENSKFLCSRVVIAEVQAADQESAMSKWRAISLGEVSHSPAA